MKKYEYDMGYVNSVFWSLVGSIMGVAGSIYMIVTGAWPELIVPIIITGMSAARYCRALETT